MIKNIQKLKYFQDFLKKKDFSSIITINKDEDIDFTFSFYDGQGYRVKIEIDTKKFPEQIIDISIRALYDILAMNVDYNDFLPSNGFDSSIDGDF